MGNKYTRKKIEYTINENGCHICISHCLNKKGYPVIKRNKKMLKISRYLWEQKNGLIPEGICVLHKCDTPACINVDHFFLGTQLDNLKDMNEKNRRKDAIVFGEKNGNHKLTEKQVFQIIEESGTQKEIAKKYDISQTQVFRIKHRQRWKYLNKIKEEI